MEVVEKTIRNTPNLHKLLTIRSVTSAEQEIQIIVFRFCRQKLHVSYKFFGVRSKNFFTLRAASGCRALCDRRRR